VDLSSDWIIAIVLVGLFVVPVPISYLVEALRHFARTNSIFDAQVLLATACRKTRHLGDQSAIVRSRA
jgi:hypothetical protein